MPLPSWPEKGWEERAPRHWSRSSPLTPDAFTENFGPTGLLDDILGTNKQFKVWLKELRRRDGEGWRHTARTALADATQ